MGEERAHLSKSYHFIFDFELKMATNETIRKRAEAYAHLDQAKLGWFHLRAVLVSGVGFFTDAYDIFVISQALPMIYQVYFPQTAVSVYKQNVTLANGTTVTESSLYTPQNHLAQWDKQNPWIDATVKAATLYGNLVGQLAFGYLGDKKGRKKMVINCFQKFRCLIFFYSMVSNL
jgi:MFS transporter, PHS family, inorganic phosphate transporter